MKSSRLVNSKSRQKFMKNNDKCVCCGNPATTVDHIIPTHLFEMSDMTDYSYHKAIRDTRNWQPMCKKCNAQKNAHLDPKEIPKFLYSKYKRYIDPYIEVRNKLWGKQSKKCYRCKKEIEDVNNSIVVYRTDYKGFDVNDETCVVVCARCLGGSV